MLLLLLSHFSCVRLCHPIDGSPLGFSVSGILQARILEWVAISFSNSWKWKAKVKSLSRAQLLATPWTAAYQAPPSMGFSRQEYWSGVSLPSPVSNSCRCHQGFLCSSVGKQSAFNAGGPVWSLDQEVPLETEMATYSSIVVLRILWREEPGRQ